MYAAAGINTANDMDETKRALAGPRGVNVEEAFTINASPEELYVFWRNFELLPRFMNHLVEVRQLDLLRSHWVAKAPAGRTVEWDAEIINEIPGELIAWRTLPGSDVVSAGSVSFKCAPGGRGTEVRVRLQYEPPAGKVGATIAWLLGHDPAYTIHEDLRRFKQLIECGEIPTTKGQPRGRS
ncbi:MAG: cyclase [Acidobacteria bacterium 13_1_40CM_65_14]|nr:MAG: cyclase [Acidobacteria bacterium 13_1_40CM_65_14]OLC76994.1 MAG: cyclase [Acidobacteria bacterium 13_1_40CM_4_65_8]OLD17587.1 MAG: cyclase [Acidobacteria bacterium 13_1_40CM_3_65_5]OLE84026.1 MAG: cyclase [Acidobacteria bacterium 13_1_20CM_2_65_9]